MLLQQTFKAFGFQSSKHLLHFAHKDSEPSPFLSGLSYKLFLFRRAASGTPFFALGLFLSYHVNMRENLIEQGVYIYEKSRAVQLTAQYLAFDWVMGLLPGTKRVSRKRDPSLIKEIEKSLDTLLRRDAKIFSSGLLPLSLLAPKPLQLQEYPRLILDGLKVYRRRSSNKNKDFSPQVKAAIPDDVPDYYRRNFHFQSDGYFSEESAERYDQQVDLLFAGTSDAMRRLLVFPLARALKGSRGKGLKILELGCGTGSSTFFMAQLFPQAEITAVDLSAHYLKHARGRLQNFLNVNFLRADIARLPFQDQQFDVVFSSFVFHELPEKVREEVLQEARRLLKPGGLISIIDSVQKGDSKAFDEVLEDFPKNFHEPFYKNYSLRPMGQMLKKAGFTMKDETLGFASKVWTAQV